MNNSKQKIFAVALGYGNIVVHNLVSFILTPLMILIWGDASYGIYKIILSLMAYFMLIDSGIKNTVIRFVSEYRASNDRKNERRYIATIFSYYVIASIVLGLIVFVLYHALPAIYSASLTSSEIQLMQHSLPWLLLYTIGTLFFNCFAALLRGHNMQISVQAINIIRSCLRFAILYLMLRKKYSVEQVIAADALITLLFATVVLFIIFIPMKLPPLFNGISKNFIKHIVNFTSIMLVYTISTSLFWSVGNFLVGIMTSSVLAAVYATSITLTNMFQSLSSTVSQVLVPDIMVKSFSTDSMEDMNKMMVRVGKIKMPIMLLIVLGFGLFGNEFVHLWVGEGYTGTYVIAFITMIPLMLGLLQDVPNNYILAKNKHKTMALISLVSSILNIALSVVLIKFIGIYGAALGTLIAYTIVFVIFTYCYYQKSFGFDMKMLYKETIVKNLPYICLLIICGIGLNFIPFNQILGNSLLLDWICLAIKIVLFIGVFLVVYFFKMADKETKKLIFKKLGR